MSFNHVRRWLFSATLLSVGTLVVAGCGSPKYPVCDSDDDCKASNEVCVDKKCVECAVDATCVKKLGQGAACKQNMCVAKPACHQDSDCGDGQKCESSVCVAKTDNSCKVDKDCPGNQECFGGFCRDKSDNTKISSTCRDPNNPGQVALRTVHFDYDKSDIRADAQKTLEQDAECLKQAPNQQVAVEGHCDDRGTVEYNLSLGEQRANAVIKYLGRLGVGTERLRPVSKGENEPVCRAESEACFAKNRRVELK